MLVNKEWKKSKERKSKRKKKNKVCLQAIAKRQSAPLENRANIYESVYERKEMKEKKCKKRKQREKKGKRN
jgi:hypothetical protein